MFVLTDQYFLERRYNIPDMNLDTVYDQHFMIKTDRDYRRYALTESGVSPRGIPGFGEGRVRVDSDEHTEDGSSPRASVRTDMVNKRLRKLDGLRKEAIAPELFGPGDYRNLVVCWGRRSMPCRKGWTCSEGRTTPQSSTSRRYIRCTLRRRISWKRLIERSSWRAMQPRSSPGSSGPRPVSCSTTRFSSSAGFPSCPRTSASLSDMLEKKETTHGRV